VIVVRDRRVAVAATLAALGIGCGVWLLVQAFREIGAAVSWPSRRATR